VCPREIIEEDRSSLSKECFRPLKGVKSIGAVGRGVVSVVLRGRGSLSGRRMDGCAGANGCPEEFWDPFIPFCPIGNWAHFGGKG